MNKLLKLLLLLGKIIIFIIMSGIGIYACYVSTGASLTVILKSFSGNTRVVLMNSVITIQVAMFFSNLSKNAVLKYRPQHYRFISRVGAMTFIVSVVSSIGFFVTSNIDAKTFKDNIYTVQQLYNLIPLFDILPFYNWIVKNTTNIIYIFLICVILDKISITFPLIGFDIMAGINFTDKQKLEPSLIDKILVIIFHKPMKWINDKYNMITCNFKTGHNDKILVTNCNQNPITNSLQKNSVIKNLSQTDYNNNNLVTSPFFNNLVTNGNQNPITNPLQLVTKNPSRPPIDLTKSKTDYSWSRDQHTNKNVTKNEKNLSQVDYNIKDLVTNSLPQKLVTKNSSQTDYSKLINTIDDYIIINYVKGDKIKVAQVKEIFGIKKSSRIWSNEIIHKLRSAKINPDNNRLYRVEVKEDKEAKNKSKNTKTTN